MKAQLSELIAGTGILIAIYLFVSNGDKTVSIIKALGGSYAQGVKTLQGR